MTAPMVGQRINPVPEVYIADSATPLAVGRPTAPGQVNLLDDLEVTWGRQRLVDHHDAQQARFTVLVPPDRVDYASWDWRNRTVRLQWSDSRVQAAPVVFFRGRVTEVIATPRPPHPETGAFRGTVLRFSCTGKLAELGNRRSGVESWPQEDGWARLARIRAIAGPSITTISYRPDWGNGAFSVRNVSNTDALSLLRSMYDSSGGDRMTYDPQTDTIAWVGRRLQPGTIDRRAVLALDPNQGYYAPRARQTGASWPMIPLTEVTSSGDLTRTTEGGATRVEYRWTSYAGSPASGVIYDPTGEADRGVVQLSLTTELADGNWSKLAASDWLDILWREGTLPQPPPMTYRADRVGGFLNPATALQLIGARELGGVAAGEPACWFLAGGPWPRMGYSPVVGIIGGTIRYADGGWSPTFHSQAVAYLGPLTGTRPLRASDCVVGGVRIRPRDMSRAVTAADLLYTNPTA